jgi:hypothetical protein
MTTEELVTLIELRHKFKREISEEEFQDIKPLKSDPAKYDIDIVDGKLVKQYTSGIYNHICDDVTCYCECFINILKKRGYNIKSFKYLMEDGYVLLYGDPRIAQQFSIAFTNPK